MTMESQKPEWTAPAVGRASVSFSLYLGSGMDAMDAMDAMIRGHDFGLASPPRIAQ